jgi:hypothetical protein
MIFLVDMPDIFKNFKFAKEKSELDDLCGFHGEEGFKFVDVDEFVV